MKKTYQYIALAAIALGFAACSQEDDFIPQGNQKDAPIAIASVGVADLTTRATITNDKLVEGGIGVTITSTGNDERYKGDNVNWYGSNGTWGLDENQKVVLYEGNGESQKIYAYYPYAKDIIEGTENFPVTLPEAFGSNFEGYDYLCTKEGISLSQNPVSITMSHAFSKVSVSISAMGNDVAGDVVTGVSLINVPRNGERSATTGAIDPDKYGPANGRIALYGYDSEDTDEVADYYIGYALPNTATTLDLRVEMASGRIFTAKAPITGGMTDGVHYKIGLKVGKDKVEVGTVTVAPWGTGGTIDGGVAEAVPYYYNAETNTYNIYLSEGVQAAIDEAELTGTAENPATVKLMADVEVAGEPNEYGEVDQDILVDAGVIVLDLNGHAITGSDKSFSVIYVSATTLTIDDSSEGKQGKIIGVCDYSTSQLLYVQAGSKLIVNNGTFEGNVYGIAGLGESTSITINGGAFKFGKTAIRPQNSSLTITGGTFEGSKYALHFNKATKALITGGSFTGGDCDINTQQATGFLSFNEETGIGPTFPGGFSIYNNTATSFTLNPLLAEGAAYYDANGNQLTLEANATSCEGDVTVKRIPTDE